MICMRVAQWGQRRPVGTAGDSSAAGDDTGLRVMPDEAGAVDREVVKLALRRLARNPLKRMRTNPRGRTWIRKRRRNSCEGRVIRRFLLPWA